MFGRQFSCPPAERRIVLLRASRFGGTRLETRDRCHCQELALEVLESRRASVRRACVPNWTTSSEAGRAIHE